MASAPSYFAAMKAEVGRIIHDLNNVAGVTGNNVRFLDEAGLPLTRDQAEALRDARISSERAAALLRELQAILG